MTIRPWWLWGLGIIGVAIVALLAVIAYALLSDEDGEPAAQVAQPTATATPTLAVTRTPVPTPTPTPPPPTPSPKPVVEEQPPPALTIDEPAPLLATEEPLSSGQQQIAELCSALRAQREMTQIRFDMLNILGLDSEFLKDYLVETVSLLRDCDKKGLGFEPIPSSELTSICVQAGRARQQMLEGIGLEDQATAIQLGNELTKLDAMIAKWCSYP